MCGRQLSTFIVVDDLNRESLAIEIYLNLTAPRVLRVQNRVCKVQNRFPDADSKTLTILPSCRREIWRRRRKPSIGGLIVELDPLMIRSEDNQRID